MKHSHILAILLLLIPFVKSHAGLINIDVVDRSGLSSSQESLFDDAVNFWESALIGTQENIDVNMQINATAPAIDGRGGILGQAGPRRGTFYDGGVYVTQGIMEFDTADLGVLETRGTLLDVIVHEMAHVIGFGTIWNFFDNLYVQNSGEYLGKYALAMYREEFDADATFVPVDIVSGVGTRNSHWDENWSGGRSDIMTGFLEGSTTVSNTTLAAFADIGYIVRLNDGRIIGANAPATLTLLLVAGAFLVRRKKY
ncbi:leishmanolysin-related zinc metalloendopeptidase [Alteromonas sp. A081]|uniref:leishmanolysin-related zinc metalloendopeptidase n=1 Tax=Alteromonas sp. A081 TaxID=3410269 RepID=UPI003B987BFA